MLCLASHCLYPIQPLLLSNRDHKTHTDALNTPPSQVMLKYHIRTSTWVQPLCTDSERNFSASRPPNGLCFHSHAMTCIEDVRGCSCHVTSFDSNVDHLSVQIPFFATLNLPGIQYIRMVFI
ncbi:hypothetical protein CHARACLAT_024938 [Characodon lateralis]|uniref:Uncharacterized protein n=1 Tax=Characodon lateralis TaxID=208331 RepID=A0ABU7DAI5_9TELE|nr:hypothetical protein [Characodon lateralis]